MRVWGILLVAVALVACGRFGFGTRGGDASNDATAGGDTGDARPPGNVAFVTSSTQPAAKLGGIAGADQVCSDRATEAGLTGTFVAYISTSTVNAIDRLSVARGWYRVDGQPVFDTVADIPNDKMIMPLRIDERGNDLDVDGVFATTGTYDGYVNATCDDYTNGTMAATAGLPAETGGTFSNNNPISCSDPTRLYCFQIDYQVALVYPHATGRRAFLSTGTFLPSTGVQTADNLCASEATAAGYTGTFLALLPDPGPAAQRFDAAGPTWVRPDGIALAATAADLLAGNPTAALNVQTSGAYVDTYVETGEDAPTAPIDTTKNCNGFSAANGGNLFGYSTSSIYRMFAKTTTDCRSAVPVYCLEK